MGVLTWGTMLYLELGRSPAVKELLHIAVSQRGAMPWRLKEDFMDVLCLGFNA